MINFFKNKKNANKDDSFSKIASLLIHAAKIDENYTNKETEIIKKTLLELGLEKNKIDETITEATIIEENSNQILDFTKEIKNIPESNKIIIVESIWKIIYSNNEADIYESNLMRRLGGLLYISSKTMGDLKEKVKKNLSE